MTEESTRFDPDELEEIPSSATIAAPLRDLFNATVLAKLEELNADVRKRDYASFEERSESIGAFMTALAKAQGSIRPAAAKAAGGFYGNDYADHTALMEAIREPLSSNGIAVVQLPALFEDKGARYVQVRTILCHGESGQYISNELSMPIEKGKDGSQAVGSATTYAKRYSLASMVGVVPLDNKGADGKRVDDDGEAASSKDVTRTIKAPRPKARKAKAPTPPKKTSRQSNGSFDPDVPPVGDEVDSSQMDWGSGAAKTQKGWGQ